MKKQPMSLTSAIAIFIIGILLGSVFTFGVRFQRGPVPREDCRQVETRLLSYKDIMDPERPTEIKEIRIDCADGHRYFIARACISSKLEEAVHRLQEQEDITLLLHPNSSTIVELRSGDEVLLEFDTAMKKLDEDTTGFRYFGMILYLLSIVGLCSTIWRMVKKKRK